MSPVPGNPSIGKKQRIQGDRFDRLVEASGALIVGVDPQGNIRLFNKRCEEVTGYSREEVLGKSVFTLFIPLDVRPEVQKRFQNAVAGKLPTMSPIVPWITKDGTRRLMRWNNTFILDEQGKVKELYAIGIDITDRKKAEARYKSLFDSVPVGIFRTTPEGTILDANSTLVHMLGFSNREDLLKRNAADFYVNPDARKQWNEFVQRADIIRGFEAQFRRQDNEIIWVQLNARAIRNNKNQVECYEGTLEDITERKQAEIEVLTARQRAEFLVDLMAHDLNNINQGIMLSLELLQNDPQLPRSLEEHVRSSLAQVERSAELIGNVKRFQSLDTEPRRLGKRDLSPPFFAAVDAVERAFPQKQLVLNTNISDEACWVMADGFLTELFFNLLHNTMKMDRKETVEIDALMHHIPDDKFVKIEIKDRGPGVPDTDKKRIFTRFHDKQNGVRGSGIGLTLVQRIIHRYGGQIWVENRVTDDHTKGANFVVLLPRGD